MDRKGYVMSGMTFLLLVPVLIICISFLNTLNNENEIRVQSIQSDNLYHASQDIKRNIPILTRDTLNETVYEIINSNLSIDDGPEYVSNQLKNKLEQFEADFEKNNNLKVECTLNSIQSHQDPWYIEVDTTIAIGRDRFYYEERIKQLISIKGLADPLPFIECGEYGVLTLNHTTILYGNVLSEYLQDKGISEASYYENATSPFIIKSCPYQPYNIHVENHTLNNCLNNGFYHQSNDGSCYLCRLEGKATCNHPGIEVFINPRPLNNPGLLSSAASIDHVIFDDYVYTGKFFTVFTFNGLEYGLFLDNGHRLKYGISPA